ncbi:MAG: SRPBCC family protein [Cytophagales bacterium]|nr:SRPBCC family protein [Rhizobacter sp.]
MSEPVDAHYKPPTAELDEPKGLRQRVLPFLRRYPIAAGVVLGLLMRFAFSGRPGGAWSAMAGAFIFCAPLAIGAVTVYFAERQRRRSWGYYFYGPFLATMLFVCGTLVIMIEGIICAIVIVPMFAVMGGIGGLVMGLVCRLTDWPRQAVYSLALVPLLLGMLGDLLPTPVAQHTVDRSTFIQAAPEVVWRHINAATDIRADEVGDAWAFRIGAPLPVSGLTRQTPEGHVRSMVWTRNVHFDGHVADADWQPPQRVRWAYRFTADSFPAGSLDDHVVIGGHYFDLQDTTYTLEPQGTGTLLRMQVSYRISTQFNLYADWVAQWLLGDFGDVILRFYKQRSEMPEPHAAGAAVG